MTYIVILRSWKSAKIKFDCLIYKMLFINLKRSLSQLWTISQISSEQRYLIIHVYRFFIILTLAFKRLYLHILKVYILYLYFMYISLAFSAWKCFRRDQNIVFFIASLYSETYFFPNLFFYWGDGDWDRNIFPNLAPYSFTWFWCFVQFLLSLLMVHFIRNMLYYIP